MNRRDKSRALAWFGAFFTIIGFLIVYLAKKEDDYAMYYAKQGLVLFFGQIIIAAVDELFLIDKLFLGPLLWAAWAVLWILAWVNALSGEKRDTWFVQDLVEKLKV
jgi:uncharacterized membrane protein